MIERRRGGTREEAAGVADRLENRLLDACRRGEAESLRRLVDAHYEPLYRFLWRLTASPEMAEELTQEAFVRALGRLHSFDGRASFSTWLHAIAINLWKDARRRLPREVGVPLEEAPLVDDGPRCDQEAMARLEREEVRQAVERLPDAQRVAILLFYYQGMTYSEIARACECPVGTVGSWIHHGVRALRRMLQTPVAERLPERREECRCA
jgi:RNA polymerase sigma-70 factor (ECF subfamily)